MKYNKIALFLFAAALFSCTREEMQQPVVDETANGLVIKADCLSTRTDISEGKSTWEAGDVISVVYDGAVYSYKTAEAGPQATFTSEAGIQSYDSSKPLTAYYPATGADGTVGVAAEGEIRFLEGKQANAAHAPLVGTPKSGNLEGGVLKMAFKNICSVIELKLEAGVLTSPLKKLTVGPASSEGFEGYLSFSGAVDPSSLAITPASSGNTLTLNFPEGADLTKEETIKFPVGRFKSPAGLQLTFETSDGKQYTKTIYKSGIQTYAEESGKFSVKHLAKALFAFGNDGGIRSAADLVDFASAVNKGESLAEWQNAEGHVVLLGDIDMSGVTEWTPIGDVGFTWASNKLTITGTPFTGYFDGQGHKITGFKAVCANSKTGGAWGLFGCVGEGGVVENLVFDSTCSLEAKPSASTEIGLIAGILNQGTIRNVTSSAAYNLENAAPNAARVTIALIGFAFAGENEALIEKVTNNASLITATAGANTNNGGNGVHISGILGFGTNDASSSKEVIVKDCVNNANIESAVPRASGIVAAANRFTNMTGCVNNGKNTNTYPTAGGSRVGNITCITGAGSSMTDVTNNGDLISTTAGCVGGVVCLVNSDDNVFTRVKSYGKVITDRTGTYVGTFFGQCNKNAKFSECVAGGDLGSYNGGSPVMVGVNAENYFSHIGTHSDAATFVTPENITFGQASEEPKAGLNTVEDFIAFRNAVNAGGDLTPFFGEDGKTVVLNADLDFTGVTDWIPIGAGTFNWASNALSITGGNAFTGAFDGKGHSIKNLALVCQNETAGAAWGLFGILGPGAVVENLVFDASSSLSVKCKAATDAGLLAGLVYDATVSNITSNAPMSFDGAAGDNKRVTMAVCGFAFAGEKGVVLENITNTGAVTATAGGNTKNGATGVQVAGILGFGTNLINTETKVVMKHIVNRGDVTSATARASGIVAAANRYVEMEDVVNYGNNINSFATSGGARAGNITCITGAGSTMKDVTNYGDLTSTTAGAIGGVVCLVNADDNSFTGVKSYGKVITDKTDSYIGTFFGQCNKAATFSGCVAGGDLGTYNAGSPKMVGVNAENYFDYIGSHSSDAVNVTKDNITYGTAN